MDDVHVESVPTRGSDPNTNFHGPARSGGASGEIVAPSSALPETEAESASVESRLDADVQAKVPSESKTAAEIIHMWLVRPPGSHRFPWRSFEDRSMCRSHRQGSAAAVVSHDQTAGPSAMIRGSRAEGPREEPHSGESAMRGCSDHAARNHLSCCGVVKACARRADVDGATTTFACCSC